MVAPPMAVFNPVSKVCDWPIKLADERMKESGFSKV